MLIREMKRDSPKKSTLPPHGSYGKITISWLHTRRYMIQSPTTDPLNWVKFRRSPRAQNL